MLFVGCRAALREGASHGCAGIRKRQTKRVVYLAAEAREARDVNDWGTLSRASSTRPAFVLLWLLRAGHALDIKA